MEKQDKWIYIYETPDSKSVGLLKIGETTRDDPTIRIDEQVKTAANFSKDQAKYEVLYYERALKDDGTEYSDKDLHRFLVRSGVKRSENTEWFDLTIDEAKNAIKQFEAGIDYAPDFKRINSFPMRKEQQKAVDLAYNYFEDNKDSKCVNNFLWNAKMRFGKTFAAYQLMKKSNWKNVLIITYRPAVRKSWIDDLNTHTDFKGYVFLTNDEILSYNKDNNNVVFMSYQDLLGSKNNLQEKHRVVFDIDWDCVIIDEFHYGSSTDKAKSMIADKDYDIEEYGLLLDQIEEDELEDAIKQEDQFLKTTMNQIITRNILYLSGTPFKAIGNNVFSNDQIFNWTYLDEQKARSALPLNDKENPYFSLPKLKMFIYEISNENFEEIKKIDANEFSLSEFFKVKGGKFAREGDVKAWLRIITGEGNATAPKYNQFDYRESVVFEKSKFPFAPIEKGGLFETLNHTFWLMPSVASCRAMADLLSKDQVFSSFKVVVAAGTKFGVGADAIPPVEKAIAENKRTITLSCGKLTEGVSIKEWSAVMFLTDIASPERYFQTAFRAQTPWKVNGKTVKEECYVFDFHPSRSLKLLTEYSTKLNPSENIGYNRVSDAKDSVAEFIKYLPVLRISGNGMSSLNENQVFSYDSINYNSSDLIKAFQSSRNFLITDEVVSSIMMDEARLDKCNDIFDKIKAYRKLNNSEEGKESDIDIKELGYSYKKLEKLKTKAKEEEDKSESAKIDKELSKENKELQKKKEKMRELLRVLLARIPLFMYLTHAQETDLEEVLKATQVDGKDCLFRKTTGIEIEEFEFLMDLGIIKPDSIDGYINRFHQLELDNYKADRFLLLY